MRFRLCISALGTLLVLACSSDQTGPKQPATPALDAASTTVLLKCTLAPASATALLGPDGGTLQIGPHSLYIPPGALTDTVTITGTVAANGVAELDFQPTGLQFLVEAQVTIDYGKCPTGQVKNLLGIVYTNGESAEEIEPSENDPSSNTVTAEIEHFSGYAVAW